MMPDAAAIGGRNATAQPYAEELSRRDGDDAHR